MPDRAAERMLRQHGASLAAAERTVFLSEQLARLARATGREASAIVDLITGAQVGPIARGLADRIPAARMADQLSAMATGRTYVHIHTHPSSASFSAADGVFLLTWPPLRTIAVRTIDGSLYLLTKTGAGPKEAAAVYSRWEVEWKRLRARYYRRIRGGRSRDEAWAQEVDGAWRAFAPEWGLRYDRIGPTTGTEPRGDSGDRD